MGHSWASGADEAGAEGTVTATARRQGERVFLETQPGLGPSDLPQGACPLRSETSVSPPIAHSGDPGPQSLACSPAAVEVYLGPWGLGNKSLESSSSALPFPGHRLRVHPGGCCSLPCSQPPPRPANTGVPPPGVPKTGGRRVCFDAIIIFI